MAPGRDTCLEGIVADEDIQALLPWIEVVL
jgi:hypothetical protein